MFYLVSYLTLKFIKKHPERITEADKKMVNYLDCKDIEFPVSKKDFSKIEKKNIFCINAFCNEKKLTYLVYVSDQDFKNHTDLLLISNKNKSHYVYIKGFSRFLCNKSKCNNKNIFQIFFTKNKEAFLKINGKQTVKL